MEEKKSSVRSMIPKLITIIAFIIISVIVVNACDDKIRNENKALKAEVKKLEQQLEKEQNKEFYVCISVCVGDKEKFDSSKTMPFNVGNIVTIVKETDKYYRLQNHMRKDLYIEKDRFKKNFIVANTF